MRKFAILLSTLLLGTGYILAQADGDAPDPEAPAQEDALPGNDQGFLVDHEGRTLYLFLNDSPMESTCFDGCAANWPPVLVGAELAGIGLDKGLIGELERPDGTMQMTYNGWPLYYYIGDQAPGDVTGQGVGEVWYVIDAGGNALMQIPGSSDAVDTDDEETGNDEDTEDTEDSDEDTSDGA